MIERFFRSVGTAGELTKSLLWPFKKEIWLKLFLLIIFSGAGYIPSLRVPFPTDFRPAFNAKKTDVQTTTSSSSFKSSTFLKAASTGNINKWKETARIFWSENKRPILALAGALIFSGVIFIILLHLLICRLKFVLIKSLVTRQVAIRRYWKETAALGYSLFWVDILLSGVFLLFMLTAAGAVGYGFYKGLLAVKSHLLMIVAGSAVFGVFLFCFSLLYWIINKFLPIYMLEKNMKIGPAIRDLCGLALKMKLKAGAYLFLYMVFSFAVGMGVVIVGVILVMPAIVVGVIGGVLVAILAKTAAMVALALVIGLGFICAALAIAGVIAIVVPLQTFMAYLRIEMVGYLPSSADIPAQS